MLSLSPFLALSLAMSAPAPAPGPTDAAPATEEDKKIICQSIKVTGSRLAVRRICGTKKDWELMRKEAEEEIRKFQSQSKRARDQ